MNRPEDCSDTQINRLIDESEPFSLPEVKRKPSVKDHPLAERLYRRFKPGSDIMTVKEAYEVANELNRLLDRIDELEERLGLPQGRDDSDDGDDE